VAKAFPFDGMFPDVVCDVTFLLDKVADWTPEKSTASPWTTY
jgi:hypothetical protein